MVSLADCQQEDNNISRKFFGTLQMTNPVFEDEEIDMPRLFWSKFHAGKMVGKNQRRTSQLQGMSRTSLGALIDASHHATTLRLLMKVLRITKTWEYMGMMCQETRQSPGASLIYGQWRVLKLSCAHVSQLNQKYLRTANHSTIADTLQSRLDLYVDVPFGDLVCPI